MICMKDFDPSCVVPLSGLKLDMSNLTTLIDDFWQSHDYDDLRSRKKWHNNIPVSDKLKRDIGPLATYLKEQILVVTVFPSMDINIHADGAGTKPDNTYNVSINIPVENCTTNTKTAFWTFPDNRPIEYVHYEKLGTRGIKDKEQLIKLCEFSMTDTPVLFRNEFPHSVENKFDGPRTMLSWRFRSDYSWSDAYNICADLELL